MVQASLPSRLRVLLANEQEGWHQTVRGLLEPQGVQTVSAIKNGEARLKGVGRVGVAGIDPSTITPVYNFDWVRGSALCDGCVWAAGPACCAAYCQVSNS